MGYYTTAVAILEKTLKERDAKGKGKASEGVDGDEAEEREMAVTALVAMIEIWMSDLWCVSSLAPGSRADIPVWKKLLRLIVML